MSAEFGLIVYADRMSVSIFTLVVDDEGHKRTNLGNLSFPHVPQIGSRVLVHPLPEHRGDSLPEEHHVYEVVGVSYQFEREEGEGGGRVCSGWEIDVHHLGSHLDVPVKL